MPAPRKRQKEQTENHITPRHEDCWAKTTEAHEPGINVRDHCLNVGFVAQAVLERVPDMLKSALKIHAGPILAALHDIGKVSAGFQSKCEKWLITRCPADRSLWATWRTCEDDHAKISQFTVQQMLGDTLYRWAAILGAHHGKIKGERIPAITEQYQSAWDRERRRLAHELGAVFGPLPSEGAEEATLWFLAGLVTFADWIGSNEEFFPQKADWDKEERRACAKRALDSIGWNALRLRKDMPFGDLFPGWSPNDLQSAAMLAVNSRGLYLIEGPMGSGKTEAALAAAYRLVESGEAGGIYFGLPTQLTSNRIYLRVQQYLNNCADSPTVLRLAHSASWLQEFEPPPCLLPTSPDVESQEHVRSGRSWFASPKRALLAPFGVGTIDQALLGIVAANHFFVRQFGLAGKVVILDEVHSYDLYTSTLIDALVHRLRELQCTVIILSATLTKARRRQLLQTPESKALCSAYPLVSGFDNCLTEVPCEPPPQKAVSVRWVPGHNLIEQCIERARQRHCVLWIRNTVDDAQETCRRLMAASYEGGPQIGLLHSRFPFFRREELEGYWIEALGKNHADRPPGCVLVATQVAEQSVDIDADLLITDLAPTDMLLQRVGRLWRHDQPNRPCLQPEVWIAALPVDSEALANLDEKECRNALGKSARVYAPYVLLRSFEQWSRRTRIILPDDIRPILEATYAVSHRDEPEGWGHLRKHLEAQKRKLQACALSATGIWNNPALHDEEDVQTRYSSYPMAQLLLAHEIKNVDRHSVRLGLLNGEAVVVYDRNWNFDTAKAIHKNLARVPRWAISAVLPGSPDWLRSHVHQPSAAGIVQSDGSIRWLEDESETGLSYHVNQGIIIDRERMPRRPREELDESYD